MKEIKILTGIAIIAVLCACATAQQRHDAKVEKMQDKVEKLQDKAADSLAKKDVMSAIFAPTDDASQAQAIMANPQAFYIGEKTAQRIKYYFEHSYQVPDPRESPTTARSVEYHAERDVSNAIAAEEELKKLMAK